MQTGLQSGRHISFATIPPFARASLKNAISTDRIGISPVASLAETEPFREGVAPGRSGKHAASARRHDFLEAIPRHPRETMTSLGAEDEFKREDVHVLPVALPIVWFAKGRPIPDSRDAWIWLLSGGLTAAFVLILTWAWWRRETGERARRGALESFRQVRRLRFDEGGFTIERDHSSSRCECCEGTRLSEGPGYVRVTGPEYGMAIPLADLPVEAMELLRRSANRPSKR